MPDSASSTSDRRTEPPVWAAGNPVASSSGGSGDTRGTLKYRAFLSYSHADEEWARWLMRRLESYRVAVRFHGRVAPIGTVGRTLAPVFRDRDEMPSASDLGETLRTALAQSETLVVICSPAAAQSRWVNEEILTFKRLGRASQVFAFIVAGEPNAKGAGGEECFPPALRFVLGPDGGLAPTSAELVAADARPQGDGRDDAFIRLVAGLLGVGFDDLRQRELHRRHRRMTFIAIGSFAGMTVTIGLAVTAWMARDDARRRQEQGEELLAFMLNDMKSRLQKADRLDALEEVGAKAMAYFAALNPRDLTDTTLARQASALRQIGEMRLAQLRYGEAEAALTSAFERTAALAERHPTNGELLFERGQAEFSIGSMHRKRGEFQRMGEWFARYRDTGAALVRLDPQRAAWQGELAYGLHNMAVYDLDRGRLDEARRGFLAELEHLAHLAGGGTNDTALQFRIVDANSWLGSLEERSGNLAEALARFSRQVTDLESIVRLEPGHAKWQARLAEALALRASILAIVGRRGEAMDLREKVQALFEELVARDPKNRMWQKSLFLSRVKEGRLLLADGKWREGRRIADEVLSRIGPLAALEPTDVGIAQIQVAGLRVRVDAREMAGDAEVSQDVALAVAIGERVTSEGKAAPEMLGETAKSFLAAGRLAARRADPAAALQIGRRAVALVDSPGNEGVPWPLLDAKARALIFLGDVARGTAVIQHLKGIGFQPLEPWPDPAHSVAALPVSPKP